MPNTDVLGKRLSLEAKRRVFEDLYKDRLGCLLVGQFDRNHPETKCPQQRVSAQQENIDFPVYDRVYART